ncbi:phosphatase PAP2 family protein [Spirillospora sp. NPDC046719]
MAALTATVPATTVPLHTLDGGTLAGLDGPSIDGAQFRGVTAFAQHTTWLQPVMKLYTTAGLAALCALALLAWWSARHRDDRAAMTAIAWTGIGTLLCIGTGLILKQVFAESRPCLAIHTTTVQPCPGPSDYSFPSDHTVVAVALAAGIWLAHRRLGVLAAALAAIEGFSRVYLGQHYPHDVLAAAVLSVLIIAAGWLMVRRPLAALLRALARTPLRPLIARTG